MYGCFYIKKDPRGKVFIVIIIILSVIVVVTVVILCVQFGSVRFFSTQSFVIVVFHVISYCTVTATVVVGLATATWNAVVIQLCVLQQSMSRIIIIISNISIKHDRYSVVKLHESIWYCFDFCVHLMTFLCYVDATTGDFQCRLYHHRLYLLPPSSSYSYVSATYAKFQTMFASIQSLDRL